ncbi:non-heme iron oxygenase ferredoxin subunit [Paraburkholderia hospita]|uniref:Non-heme iron oxygenase ferredoxin subunit n=1 Tax=Paraburkholderia hospita TaxID=169430 RepID=A0AAN1JHV0_9BURK|nr:non-heme iron oxygenase ferredoxin subunit [Paraburkholderia hospita]AUT73638.1 non-heme iron oxygenase ferredoxin subunit [Paraburkholderia hospita]EIM99148.1 rieske (2Fe-2S) iron-sulfur domain containing protein [Paraburkholderia hospita]OUL72820.1 (2Fe-2S)-binding protein [Paraburkholderia hospita]OUL97229.1 (2Fe-2S)-binding protein [Paraburkholderia hospita]SEH73258.1 naphthalene 1,2-dioxygenase system ferredoxin subunit [Paraburkholderia hospita]
MNAVIQIMSADARQYVCGDNGWFAIGPLDEVFGARACRGIDLEGVKIGLFRVDDEIHALDDICTHGAALLSDGEFEGHEIECPLHAGLVDVRTGRALSAPISRDTRRHETKIEGDVLFVRMQA